MKASDWERVARAVYLTEPWSWSSEGLDDCCMYCGAWTPSGSHLDDCPWVVHHEAIYGRPADYVSGRK